MLVVVDFYVVGLQLHPFHRDDGILSKEDSILPHEVLSVLFGMKLDRTLGRVFLSQD